MRLAVLVSNGLANLEMIQHLDGSFPNDRLQFLITRHATGTSKRPPYYHFQEDRCFAPWIEDSQ